MNVCRLTILITSMLLAGTRVSLAQGKLDFTLMSMSQIMNENASTGGISWIDIDSDGDDDVFVTNGYDVSRNMPEPQPNSLFENVDGLLVFRPGSLSGGNGFSSGSAWADFDNDGLPDVFIPNQKNQNNFLYHNMGDWKFEPVSDSPPTMGGGLSFSASWGDIDGDSFVDLFVSNGGLSGEERNFLFRNRDGKTFYADTSSVVVEEENQSGGATFTDYDLDGDLDLFVPGARAVMFRNDGKGNFSIDQTVPFSENLPPSGISVSGAWGDFDNDGDFDLFQVFSGNQPRRFFRNDGRGHFKRAELGDATSEVSNSFHSLWVDLDNDGYLDLVIANWGDPPHIYRNEGGRVLTRIHVAGLEERPWYASMVASSDFDLDGDVDLIVGNWPGEPGDGEKNLLYRNDGEVGNWIALRLVGTTSNRSAIGARVQLSFQTDTGTQTITREVRSQDGWRSQSSLEVVIGLGDATLPNEIKIFWPSGIIQQVGPLQAGKRHTVVEKG